MDEQTAGRPRVSIAMASFNGEKYLREQLDSLAAQTMLPCELVVTDDGSADATLEILDAFAAVAPFPVIVHRNAARLGYGRNFLQAASLCTGSLIAFCDQDDVWMPRKLAAAAEVFANADILLVLHAADIINAAGVPMQRLSLDSGLTKTSDPHAFFLWDFGFRGCTMTVRKDVILLGNRMIALPPQLAQSQLDYPGSPISHDAWIYFLASFLGKIVSLDESLIKHRRHEANTSGDPVRATSLSVLQRLRQPKTISLGRARRMYRLGKARGLLIRTNAAVCREAFAADVEEIEKIYENVAQLYLLKYLILKETKGLRKVCLLVTQSKRVCQLFARHRLNFAAILFQSLLHGMA